MKQSASSLVLRVVAASLAGLMGVAFSAAPLMVLPYVLRVHGLVSFVTAMDILSLGIGLGVVVLAIGVGFRRRWAHSGLVRAVIGLIILFAIAVTRKLLQFDDPERWKSFTFGPILLIAMGVVLFCLLHRRLREDLLP